MRIESLHIPDYYVLLKAVLDINKYSYCCYGENQEWFVIGCGLVHQQFTSIMWMTKLSRRHKFHQ